MPAKAYIALGSNLDHPARQIQQAISALKQLPNSHLSKAAPWYRSRAIGPGEQPDYLNTVVAITTELTPQQLLDELQTIENHQGRQRMVRWGPRTIDLDIVLYGDQMINTERLTIPHPRLSLRNFVLYPLADIAPDLLLPDQTSLQQLLANASAEGIVRIKAGELCGSTG